MSAPIPDPRWAEQGITAPSMADQELRRSADANPTVDAIGAAMGPDHRAGEPDAVVTDVSVLGPDVAGVEFTPWERRPQRVADEVTRVIHEGGGPMYREDGSVNLLSAPTLALPSEYAGLFDIDYLHSDLPGRGVLPLLPRGRFYLLDDLRDELVNRGPVPRPASKREALARREQQYIDDELTVAVTGPVVKVVRLYRRSMFGDYRQDGLLPNGERMALAFVAWPVPAGYTAFRVARMLTEYAFGCWWCGKDVDCAVMLVSSGGSLLLFATCEDCIDEIGDGPDYYARDLWDAQHGFPCESAR
ncbi:hypothetical protein VX037_17690 [Gordonia sp. Z-3]|uniref:hypothetical protein n=1 Tax=Gordonia sp. Z-3 TaxID=3115408 RepID=UPI002E2BDC83|nr:hypothetical protein [Gordonia sp. Z-3]MED5802863.1 hypothetical protein [Gordonia sp. Z-3]